MLVAMIATGIERSVAHAVERMRTRHQPLEACGLVIENSRGQQRIVRCPNRAPTPKTHYLLRPSDWLRLWRAADRLGGHIVGVWHTHPRTPARLSVTDRAMAWPEHLQIVAGVDGVRVFENRDGAWRICFEQPLGAES